MIFLSIVFKGFEIKLIKWFSQKHSKKSKGIDDKKKELNQFNSSLSIPIPIPFIQFQFLELELVSIPIPIPELTPALALVVNVGM